MTSVLYISPTDLIAHPQIWSGTALSMLQALHAEEFNVTLIVVPPTKIEQLMRVRKKFHWILGKRGYELWSDPVVFNRRRRGVLNELKSQANDYDIVFSWMPWCLELVDSTRPKVFWYDTTFKQTQPLYFPNMCYRSKQQCLVLDARATQKSSHAIYSTNWSVQSAIEDYGMPPERVSAIPFGPNIDVPTDSEFSQALLSRESRLSKSIDCLFVATDWRRKGGSIALDAIRHLHKKDSRYQLHIVGTCEGLLPTDQSFIHFHGKLDKTNPDQLKKLRALYLNSHIFILPTRADSSPIVVCEALAFGLPCIVSGEGGICAMVKDGVEGATLTLGPSLAKDLSDSIESIISSTDRFRQMSLSARERYREEFNWRRSGKRLAEIIRRICT